MIRWQCADEDSSMAYPRRRLGHTLSVHLPHVRAAVALGFVFSLTVGCSAGPDSLARVDESTRSEDGFVVTGGQIGILKLRLGDCFQAWGTGAVEIVDAVPCREEHDHQVMAVFELSDSGWPGITMVSELSITGCLERYGDVAADPYDASVAVMTALAPTEDSWADDRSVLCIVESATDEQLRGSLIPGTL